MSIATLEGGRLVIRLSPGVDGRELKELGARWSASPDSPRGRWELPVASWLFEWAGSIIPQLEAVEAVLEAFETKPLPILSHWRKADLYDFQTTAAGVLMSAYRRGDGMMLAMSPGLGKTATAIVAADELDAPEFGVLVVAPRALLRTWAREIAAWSGYPSSAVAHGLTPERIDRGGWTLTSYDTLAAHPEWFNDREWQLAIFDESVLVKSHASRRFKQLEIARVGQVKTKLKPWIKHAWLLSGSPTTRYADDLWAQLRLIRPGAFSSYWRFAERYCYVEPNAWGPGKVVRGSKNSMDPAKDNHDVMHVVNQEDVLDLPEYLFETVYVDLGKTQRRVYNDMLKEFLAELDGRELDAKNKAARLTRLLQLASSLAVLDSPVSAKHDVMLDLVADGIFKPPYLAWCHWKEGAKQLAARLTWPHVYGDTSDRRRDEMIEAYKRGDEPGIVMSPGVGKYGHTLTNTETMFYVDKTWDADAYVQTLRRVRRIGLTHRPTIVSLHATNTADDLVVANLEGKLGSMAKMTNANLREMLAGIGR